MNYILKVKLSDLPKNIKMDGDEYFIVSKNLGQTEQNLQKYESYKLKFSILQSKLFTTLCAIDNFSPKGTFDFTSAKYLLVDNDQNRTLSSVATIGYLKPFLKKLEDLSSSFYQYGTTNFSYPSFVGQVIMSYKQIDKTDFDNHFGKDTTWVERKGRFMLGVGSPNSNDYHGFGEMDNPSVKFKANSEGGEYSVTIPTFLKHSHKFYDCEYEKFPAGVLEMSLGTETQLSMVEYYSKTKRFNYRKNGHIEWALGPNKTKKQLTTQTKDVSKSFTFKASGDILDSNARGYFSNGPHNNIPPNIDVYMYERTK